MQYTSKAEKIKEYSKKIPITARASQNGNKHPIFYPSIYTLSRVRARVTRITPKPATKKGGASQRIEESYARYTSQSPSTCLGSTIKKETNPCPENYADYSLTFWPVSLNQMTATKSSLKRSHSERLR